MYNSPRISVCVPAHYGMYNYDLFMERLVNSLDQQTFRDFELIVTHEGKMAANTNAGIKKAKGEIIKILYMDDYLYDKDALKRIDESFASGWLATGCVHDYRGEISSPHIPEYNDNIRSGNNTIGSPSVVAFENKEPLLFDEKLSWLLDCDLYHRLHERYGEPTLLESLDVAIGIGAHQTSFLMSDKEKREEHEYITQKYATTH